MSTLYIMPERTGQQQTLDCARLLWDMFSVIMDLATLKNYNESCHMAEQTQRSYYEIRNAFMRKYFDAQIGKP